MICSELDHGQTLNVVIILFAATSLKYFSDLIARLLMCFVCVSSKAGIVRIFWYPVQRNQKFHEICREVARKDIYPCSWERRFPLFLEHWDSWKTFTLVPEKVDSLCFRNTTIHEDSWKTKLPIPVALYTRKVRKIPALLLTQSKQSTSTSEQSNHWNTSMKYLWTKLWSRPWYSSEQIIVWKSTLQRWIWRKRDHGHNVAKTFFRSLQYGVPHHQ